MTFVRSRELGVGSAAPLGRPLNADALDLHNRLMYKVA